MESAGRVFITGTIIGKNKNTPPEAIAAPIHRVIAGPLCKKRSRGRAARSIRRTSLSSRRRILPSVSGESSRRRTNPGSHGSRPHARLAPSAMIAAPKGVERPGTLGIRNGAARTIVSRSNPRPWRIAATSPKHSGRSQEIARSPSRSSERRRGVEGVMASAVKRRNRSQSSLEKRKRNPFSKQTSIFVSQAPGGSLCL